MSLCKAKTKNGLQCSKKSTSSGYCSIHYKKFVNESKEVYECPICYEDFDSDNAIILHCNHSFCKNCLIKSNKAKCALCRSEFNEEEKTKYILNFDASKKAITELISIFKTLESVVDLSDDVKIANLSCKLAGQFKGISLISLFGDLDNFHILSKVCSYEDTINSNEFKNICNNL
jgi:hypothetical protein